MNRLIEIAAMVLGGVSLFAVCFVGFLTMSGKPLHEVAVIGRFFPAPAGPEAGSGGGDQPPGDAGAAQAPPSERPKDLTDPQVLDANLGILGAWTLPSPYSASELRTLQDQLKTRLRGLDEREAAVAAREHQVQEQVDALQEREQNLEHLRASLESYEAGLSEREQSLQLKEGAAEQRQQAKWAEVARVLAGLPDEDAGKRLLEYTPEDAA